MNRPDPAGPRPELSVVIVHYETPAVLAGCLAALRASTGIQGMQVFVIDNASQTFEAAACERALPGVTVIQNGTNVGFATASNQGLRLATGRHLLLLNPDAEVEPGALATISRYLDAHAEAGCATARLVLPDGGLDLACRRSFPTPLRAFYRLTLLSRLFPHSRRFGQYNLTYLDEHAEAEIDAPCGAFMMVRSEIRDLIGLLNEDYFMYGEDIDWAFRMKAAGWHIRYVPAATVHHLKRGSSRNWRPRTVRAFYDAMRIFYRDHYQSAYPRWVTWLTYRGIDLREGVELLAIRLTSKDGS